MKNRRPCLRIVLVFAIVAMLFTLPLGGLAEEKNDTFNMIFWGVVSLNPARAQTRTDFNVMYLLQTQLVRFYGSQIQMDAASSFEKNEDGTRYVFHLREGLKWENGDALTARDFEYGAYCVLSPDMGSPKASSFYEIKNAKAFAAGEDGDWSHVGIRATDELTLEIELEYGVQDYEKTLASKHLYPMNQVFVEAIGIDAVGANLETTLCSGPYRVAEWRPEDLLRLEKNEDYWDSAASFPTKTINLMQVTDDNAMISMFERQEADAIIQIASDYYALFDEYAYKGASGRIQYLWLNEHGMREETAALMGNQNFRKALSYAIDRTEIVNAINIANEPCSRMISAAFAAPSGNAWVEEYPVDSAPLTADAEKSKAYLEAALEELGYASVDELPELLLMTYEDLPQKQECELIIDQWKKTLGLTKVKMVSYAVGTAISNFYQLNYDIFSIAWETEVRPTDAMRSFMTGGTANAGIWSNPEYDALLEASLKESDPEKAAELAWQAEQLFNDEVPMIPLYERHFESLVQPYVTGYQLGFVDGMEFNELTVSR